MEPVVPATPRAPATGRWRGPAWPRPSGRCARESAERPRPAPPAPLAPAPAFADPLFIPSRAVVAAVGAAGLGPRPDDAPACGPASRSSTAASTPPTRSGPARRARSSRRAAPCAATTTPRTAATPGHGTHVAGIAAAPANGVGVVGVAPAGGPAAQVIPIQIANRFGESSDLTMIRGIRHAVRNGARVIEHLGGRGRATRAPSRTRSSGPPAQGAVIVASVGNDYDGNAQLPGRLPRRARSRGAVRRPGLVRLPPAVRGRRVLEPQPLGRRDRPGRQRALERAPARGGAGGAPRLRPQGRHLDVGRLRVRRRRPGDGEQRRRAEPVPGGAADQEHGGGHRPARPRRRERLRRRQPPGGRHPHGAGRRRVRGQRRRQVAHRLPAPGAGRAAPDDRGRRQPLRGSRRRLRRDDAARRADPRHPQVPARRRRPLPLEAGDHDGRDLRRSGDRRNLHPLRRAAAASARRSSTAPRRTAATSSTSTPAAATAPTTVTLERLRGA